MMISWRRLSRASVLMLIEVNRVFVVGLQQLWNKNSRTKSSKKQSVIRMTGLRSPDDHFKVRSFEFDWNLINVLGFQSFDSLREMGG